MESEFEIKEMKIEVPEGYEIDEKNSTFECIKFKSIKKKLPKTWIEFCETYPRRKGEYWIGDDSQINSIYNSTGCDRRPVGDSNLLPNVEYAKAMLALCKLIQLRDCYNDGWQPDWSNDNSKYIIYASINQLIEDIGVNVHHILAFKTRKLRDEFLNNFKDLIETAEPLI